MTTAETSAVMAGTHDRRGLPRQRAAPVGHEGQLVLLVHDQAFVADDGPQAVENG
ncbi:hypothetical protein ACVWXM_006425 [Bradyrhizobium sp. GM7.3]